MLRHRVTAIAASVLLATLMLAATAGAASAIEAREVAGGLDAPVAFTFGPGKHLWYVEKDTGEIRVIDLASGDDSSFVTVSGVDGEGERGMLGIALHPRYPAKPFVYVYVTRTSNGNLRNQILRFRDDDGSGTDEKVIFNSAASSSPYHNGGRISFGPDRKLYAIVGDGHDASNAQDRTDNDLGKIIRLEANGDVPATNPFDDLIWAYGIRNSFGFAFDPLTGELWESENGPGLQRRGQRDPPRAELRVGAEPRPATARSPGNTNQDGPDPVRPETYFEDPIGITGIAFCDGCGLGRRSQGAAFFGGVNSGPVYRLILDGDRDGVERRTVVFDHSSGTLSFEVGPGGTIYFSDFGGIFKLVRG